MPMNKPEKTKGQFKPTNLKIAITHDYLLEFGGAEMVLWELLRMFPQADLYTAFHKPTNKQRDFWFEVQKHKHKTSKFNKLPLLKHYHKLLIPFTIRFFEKLDLSEYDLVISSSANFAKWINLKGKNSKTKHIAYIHTPPRFLWGYDTALYYKVPRGLKFISRGLLNKWREKDKMYARKADLVLANSKNIQSKIKQVYAKDSTVIYPPVAIETLLSATRIESNSYFLTIGRLYNYKKMNLIVNAFTEIGKNDKFTKLVIIGDGPERSYLEKLAGKNIEFKGFVEENEKTELLRGCRGFVFAAEEDFGIVMIEALAAGAPVIAYGKGGALEIVENRVNGTTFPEQTTDSLIQAVDEFKKMKLNSNTIKKTSQKFSKKVFDEQIIKQINLVV